MDSEDVSGWRKVWQRYLRWQQTPRGMGTASLSIVFLILFPWYFASMEGFISTEDWGVGGAALGKASDWDVTFNEVDITQEETVDLSNNEAYESSFDLQVEDAFIGYVQIDVSCDDNDEPGPGFSDSVEAQTDFSEVSGELTEQSGNGNCNGLAVSLSVPVTASYTGEDYSAEGVSQNSIIEQWNDKGSGRGEWKVIVTLDVNNGPTGPLGNLVDNGEQVTISWRAVSYTVDITPAAEPEN